ncbi:CHASE2 domain-containing protein [Pseudoalteromonas denitrificans]|uniref:Adenylate cyclase n=1 Tax=Pseudoalteromonas denitrificans DSM 6059 TaxID=1123010 RepID=A0A1I1FKJ3_9GAMM|nr:adenylate/guanylate cyclase domain-containing protein [Pseudoalteromonas denitrificans]SFB99506.1 adenylate cyclase [Pseudoalteromonas denitrificans DSM 6059]
MNIKKLMIRVFLTGIVFISIVFHSSGHISWKVINQVENFFYDARLLYFMPDTVDEKIIILDIDEKSLLEQGQWPWTRDKLASLVNTLFDHYEINSLGFDAVFAEPDDSSALNLLKQLQKNNSFIDQTELNKWHQKYDTDQQFSESLIARNLVLGYVFKQSHNQKTLLASGLLPPPLAKSSLLNSAKKMLFKPVGFTSNIPILQDAAIFGGFFDYVSTQDVLRKVPLIQEYKDEIYTSLALELTRLSLGFPEVNFVLSESSDVIESIQLGDFLIPVDKTGSIFVPYRGHLGSFKYISATDVLSLNVAQNILKNKIVLLGTSAAGLLDLRSTPVGESFIGVEVHANIISGILEQRFLKQPDYILGIELSVLFILSLIMTFIFPRLKPIMGVITIIILSFVYISLNLYFWSNHQLVIPLATPLLLLAGCAFLHINYNFFIEQKHKRHLSKVFSHYIPQELVKDFDINEAQMSLTGESREMSVLFTDVRNFTAMSENMPATELTQLMNEFLTPITKAIHTRKGTIDKYMGDAVMAFWGAPVKNLNHAHDAIQTALDIIEQMQGISTAFKQKGWPKIKVGIGVSSGNMNVGNMGSEFRIAYTVMGDIVNLGSRLEGLTKIYGVDIIVSEATSKLAPKFNYRTLDKVRVKGKQEPITIYQPLNIDAQKINRLKIYHDALTLYWQQCFSEAKMIFIALYSEAPELLIDVYINRCELFEKSPPDINWDGVFTHTSK